MSGNRERRFAPVTASARRLFDFTCGTALTGLLNIAGTWPAIRSVLAGAAPRYGTWIKLTEAACANSTAARCVGVPRPAFATDNPSDLLFAKATKSFTDFGGAE